MSFKILNELRSHKAFCSVSKWNFDLKPFMSNSTSQKQSRWQLLRVDSKRCYVSDSTIPLTNTIVVDESKDLLVEVNDGIRKITFNRPHKKNAVTFAMMLKLMSALEESNSDEKTTVIVITGSEDYFTSGMDMSISSKPETTHKNNNVSDKPKVKKRVSIFSKILDSFVDCKKPIIGLVNGPAIGFGVTFLGLFDSVYASEKATFNVMFTRYGLPPEFSSTYTFPRIMGYAKANNLLLFNNKITAQEAFNCGLVSRVYSHENFHEEAMKLIKEYGKLPVKSLMYSKELVRGRQISFIKHVSETEQSYFDPDLARKLKEQYSTNKFKK